MNISLITWCSTPNFGTCLQAFALQKVLQDMGHSVKISTDVKFAFPLSHYLVHLLLFPIINFSIDLTLAIRARNPLYLRKMFAIRRWDRKHLNILSVRFAYQARKLVRNTDCFIVGSDQLWNTYHNFDPTFFLSFASDKPRLSYATSIGTSDINPIHSNAVKELLLRFNRISVRETTGATALTKLTKRDDIVQMPDPTFLLSRDEWESYRNLETTDRLINEPYLFCYLVGTNDFYKRQISELIDRLKINHVVLLTSGAKPTFRLPNMTIIQSATPFQFLALLRNADFVCTDSFHCTAFALIYNRQFINLTRFDDSEKDSQNSRITDLLSRFGIHGRLLAPTQAIPTALDSIDYSPINKLLISERARGRKWLASAIAESIS